MPMRMLKATICESRKVNALSAEEERLFYRLLVQVDDYGRMDGRPAILRARCFPLKLNEVTDKDVSGWLQGLTAVGLVTEYVVDGSPLLCLPAFSRHQRLRAKRSQYPPPDGVTDSCPQDADTRRPEEKRSRREVEENLGAAPPARRTRLPLDFTLTPLRREYARSKGLLAVEPEFEKFTNYHRAKGSTMLDWEAAWRTWVGNAVGRFAGPRGPSAANGNVGHGAAVPNVDATRRMLEARDRGHA